MATERVADQSVSTRSAVTHFLATNNDASVPSRGLFRIPIGEEVGVYATIALIAAATDLDDDGLYWVRGYNADDDDGGGMFRFNSAGGDTANAGTVVTVTSGGQLKRQLNGTTLIPEMFGAYGDGTSNDTVAVQAFVNHVCNNQLRGVFENTYAITSTILLPDTSNYFELDCRRAADISSTTPYGALIWDGGNTDVMLEIPQIRRASISVSLNNRIKASTGITGILIHNLDSSVTAINHNIFEYVSIAGCDLAMQWGDFTNDGWHSNFDDNKFNYLNIYDCKNGLLIDSDSQDNNVIQFFHSGGVPSISTRVRDYVVRALRNGNGFHIIDGFCRADKITADNAVIDIQASGITVDKFSMETGGDDDVLPLKLGSAHHRGQSVIRNLYLSDNIRDSSGDCVNIAGRGGTLLMGCNLSGNVTHSRPLTAINNVFEQGAIDSTGDTDGSTAVITGLTNANLFWATQVVTLSAGFAVTSSTVVSVDSATQITVADNSDSSQTDITVTGEDCRIISSGSNDPLFEIPGGTRSAVGSDIDSFGAVSQAKGYALLVGSEQTGAISVNMAGAGVVLATMSAARSVAAPTNVVTRRDSGRSFSMRVTADGTNRVLTFNAAYLTSFASNQVTVNASTTSTFSFMFDGTSWFLTGYESGIS